MAPDRNAAALKCGLDAAQRAWMPAEQERAAVGAAVAADASRRRRSCDLYLLYLANRISMVKYQRLFGGAEPLTLIKEIETDFYPSGGVLEKLTG